MFSFLSKSSPVNKQVLFSWSTSYFFTQYGLECPYSSLTLINYCWSCSWSEVYSGTGWASSESLKSKGPFGMAPGSFGSGWHPDMEHCSNTVARSCFLSPPFSSHCSAVTVHGAGEARISGSSGSGSDTLQCMNSARAEASRSGTKRGLTTRLGHFRLLVITHFELTLNCYLPLVANISIRDHACIWL